MSAPSICFREELPTPGFVQISLACGVYFSSRTAHQRSMECPQSAFQAGGMIIFVGSSSSAPTASVCVTKEHGLIDCSMQQDDQNRE
jgi:hypothetical protein